MGPLLCVTHHAVWPYAHLAVGVSAGGVEVQGTGALPCGLSADLHISLDTSAGAWDMCGHHPHTRAPPLTHTHRLAVCPWAGTHTHVDHGLDAHMLAPFAFTHTRIRACTHTLSHAHTRTRTCTHTHAPLRMQARTAHASMAVQPCTLRTLTHTTAPNRFLPPHSTPCRLDR